MSESNEFPQHVPHVPCRVCDGKGWHIDWQERQVTCDACSGDGSRDTEKRRHYALGGG